MPKGRKRPLGTKLGDTPHETVDTANDASLLESFVSSIQSQSQLLQAQARFPTHSSHHPQSQTQPLPKFLSQTLVQASSQGFSPAGTF